MTSVRAGTDRHPPVPIMVVLEDVLAALADSKKFAQVPGGAVEIAWRKSGCYRVTIDLNPWLAASPVSVTADQEAER